jgi:hypothetical protein
MPTPSCVDGDVPTVAIGTNYADGIFSGADGTLFASRSVMRFTVYMKQLYQQI